MSLVKSIKGIWSSIVNFVKNLYTSIDALADKYCPVAIQVVEAVKKANESSTGDIISLIVQTAIPGNADDIAIAALRTQLKRVLPVVLADLQITQAIAKEKDINKQLQAILDALKFSSNDVKNAFYHEFSAKVLVALSDGKLTWSEGLYLSEYYYTNIYKK